MARIMKLQASSVKPIRGDDAATSLQKNCQIPMDIISRLEHEIEDVEFGGISLIISIRNRRPSFRIEKTLSFIAGA